MLEPRDPGKVGIYACGPTVYSRIHVGNARPYVVFSLLKRFLEHEGLEAVLVANVTDINDKIYTAARAAGVASEELAREMTAHYIADTERLGLGRPDHEPLASEYVEPIVALIGDLIERRPRLRGRRRRLLPRPLAARPTASSRTATVDQMDQGEGVEGADRKEDPLDFALWKGEKADEDASWPSPWGRGRPGWHIECSAMAEELLGVELDIHGGGADLLFPHHENEAAQTLAARGKPLARVWMHNGMLQLADEKMSKSEGNIRGLSDALDEVGRDALLLYFIGGHYRQPIAYTRERLDAAAASVRAHPRGRAPPAAPASRRRTSRRCGTRSSTRWPTTSTPREALARVFDWIREANRREGPVGDAQLREMLEVLALDNLLEADEGPPEELVELAPPAHRGPSGEGLRRGGPAAGRGPRARAGRSGTAPPAPSSCPWRDHLRPQRGHRGPAGAAARAADLGREGRLERGAGHAGLAGRHHRPLRIGRPPGRVRGRRGVPLRERRRAARAPGARSWSRSTRSPTRRTSARCAGRPRSPAPPA